MITDIVSKLNLYFPISRNIKEAISWMTTANLLEMSPGEYAIDGKNVYAIISSYDTKPISEGKWEAHRKYIDLQHVILGEELIGYTPDLLKFETSKPYNDEKDYVLFHAQGIMMTATPQNFFIFMPQDIHMPGIETRVKQTVKKLVIKILIDY